MSKQIYDTIIIGSGPAGLSAAIYAGRGALKTLLIECAMPVSQVVLADAIENYPGLVESTNGFELIERFKSQAKKFAVEFQSGKVVKVSSSAEDKNTWQIDLEDKTYLTNSLIIASGSRHRQLGLPQEEALRGKGVSYCAVCDGAFFRDKDIAVVGGGDAAVSEALYLARFAKKVFLIHRRDRLRAEAVLAQRAKDNEKIEIIWDSVIEEIKGKEKVEAVALKNVKDSSIKDLALSALFVSIGYIPNTDFLASLIKCDKAGYIITDEAMRTSEAGIFAAGDCRANSLRQIVTACADGATAASYAIKYLDEIRGQAYDK